MILARLLRSLAAVFIVGLTSFAMVAAPAAASTPSLGEVAKFVPKGAIGIGTKAAPARLLACSSTGPVGIALCGAGIAGSIWLATPQGQRFQDDVLQWIKDNTFGKGNASRPCQWSTQPVAWGQHSVAFDFTVSGQYSLGTVPASYAPCSGLPHGTAVQATCQSPDGNFYTSLNAGSVGYDPSGAQPYTLSLSGLCGSADHWLTAVLVMPSADTRSSLQEHGYYQSGVWPGNPELAQDYADADAKTKVTLRCRKSTGAEYNVSVTVDGLVDPAASCAAGETPLSRAVDLIRFGGAVTQRLYDVASSPEFRADYADCVAAGCDMGVMIDGILCVNGSSNCETWWDYAQQNPSRVSCSWGPYSLPYGDCRNLRDAYVTPDGAWFPPDLPSDALPIPYYPTNPDYRPALPVGNGADPSWVNAGDCAPLAVNRHMEYGLQPIALQAVRCFMQDHPDFTFTSGAREYQHSGQISDHPHGLAIDLAPPNWDTPAGNQRGWDAVAYWIWNSPRLGVRYVIFDGRIWWPSSGWHVYVDPDGNTSPHRDHVHVSLDPAVSPEVYRTPSPSPSLPYPAPTPSPDPAPPTNPNPNPNPDPTPNPNPNPTPEADGPNCDGSAVTWNPRSWIVVPLKCAFVPSPEVLTKVQTEITDAGTKTGVPTWVQTVGDIPPLLEVDTSGSSCKGPPMNLPDPFPTMYLFEACEGPMKTMAGYTKLFMTVSLVVGVSLTVTSLISRGFGYDASTGSTSA